MKLSPDNKLKLYLGEYRGQGTERWRLLLCTFPQEWQENKTGFVLLLQLHTGWIPGDICSGIPAHTPERLWHSSSEIERLINVPMTALGLKKKKNNNCVCVHVRTCLCGCIIRTICCTLSPHSHLFIWRESTNIIWIPIRLTLRVHTLHHHEACTVHCNLNPLFESCVCVCKRDGRTVAVREIKTDSCQWS